MFRENVIWIMFREKHSILFHLKRQFVSHITIVAHGETQKNMCESRLC